MSQKEFLMFIKSIFTTIKRGGSFCVFTELMQEGVGGSQNDRNDTDIILERSLDDFVYSISLTPFFLSVSSVSFLAQTP